MSVAVVELSENQSSLMTAMAGPAKGPQSKGLTSYWPGCLKAKIVRITEWPLDMTLGSFLHLAQ